VFGLVHINSDVMLTVSRVTEQQLALDKL